ELIAYALEQAGYRLVNADDAWEAERLISEQQPVAAIVDLRMPAVNGWVAIIAIHQSSASPQVLVILPLEDERGLAAARGLGAKECLATPFELEVLVERVARLCPAQPVYPESAPECLAIKVAKSVSTSGPTPRKRRTRQHIIAAQSVNYVERFIIDEGHAV